MKGKKWLWIALIVVGAAVLLVAARYLYVMFWNPMSAFDPPAVTPAPTQQVPAQRPDASPSPTLTPEEELLSTADLDFMKNKVNILLLGWDESPERTEDEESELYRGEDNNFRSDVIILLTVDFEKGTAKLISVPRDTMAPIYNTEGRWKINAAFAKGGSAAGEGFQYAMKTVSNLFGGIPIEYYAGVNMTGLKAVVDAMGGVDYDVDVRIALNGRVLETGYQHLDGQQVLDYCRARKGISTDVGRADRQQRMLFAIFDQLKSRDQLANLPKIYLSVQEYIDTNLNLEQIAALSVFALNIQRENLTRTTLEGKYISNTAYSNASFYVLYNDKLVELVKDVFGITITPDQRYDVSYVEAQKAAKEALAYSTAADYLASLMPASVLSPNNPQELQRYHTLLEARDALTNLIDFDDAEEAKLPDTPKIAAARERLTQLLIENAQWLGLCQADFSEKHTRDLLPEDVVAQLPLEPAQLVTNPQDESLGSIGVGGIGVGNGTGITDPEAMEGE